MNNTIIRELRTFKIDRITFGANATISVLFRLVASMKINKVVKSFGHIWEISEPREN